MAELTGSLQQCAHDDFCVYGGFSCVPLDKQLSCAAEQIVMVFLRATFTVNGQHGRVNMCRKLL